MAAKSASLSVKVVSALYREIFSAGLRSSQRSETMNNVFRHCTMKTTILRLFVKQYKNIAERCRAKELQEDFRCHQSRPAAMLKGNKMKNQTVDLYTRRIFTMFQDELIRSMPVAIKKITVDGSVRSYRLVDGEK